MSFSSQDFFITDNSAVPDKVATFWKIYHELKNEQKKSSNHIDNDTVSGQELEQRLVSSGLFYASDAHMMILDMISNGELKEVAFDTYVRGSSGNEGDQE